MISKSYDVISYDIILENFMRTDREQRTDRQTDREFNYRGHSYPLWIVGVSGPIISTIFCLNHLLNKWQGPALGTRSGGSKNVTYRQQTT